MKRVFARVVFIFGVTALLAAAAGTEELTPPASRKPAADFVTNDLDGSKVQLSGLKGKVVLLNFWATSCGGCRVELPWLVDFDSRYRTQGLTIVGITMYGEGASIVRPFLAHNGIRYPVVIGNDSMAKTYGVTAMPMSLLIDKRGKVALTHVGIIDRASFDTAIRRLLKDRY